MYHDVVDDGGAGKKLIQITLTTPLAARQIVRGLRGVFVRCVVAMMRGHMGKAVKDVDCIGVVYHLHAFAYILHRHTVVVLVQRDIAVALYCGYGSLSDLIAVCRQRPQTVPLDRVEELAAGFPASGQIAVIEFLQRSADSPVERFQIMEHHSLKIDIHRPVHQFDCVFHECLVPGVPHPGRNHGAPVMFGKGFEVGIDHRFVAVAARDSRPEVVRHDRARGTAVEADGVLASLYQVLLFLRPHSLAICVVAARQYCDEHFHLSLIGSCLVDYLQSVSGEIDIHLVSSTVLHMANGV